MGLLRKTMSLSTAGLIDWRNDSERSAAAERAKKNAYRERTQQEAAFRQRELDLREREVALAEREAALQERPRRDDDPYTADQQ